MLDKLSGHSHQETNYMLTDGRINRKAPKLVFLVGFLSTPDNF